MIRSTAQQAISAQCDTRQPAEIAALFEAADAAFGRLDILINNAGIGSHMHPEDLSLEEWQNVLSVNITGYFLCAQQAGRRMILRRRAPSSTSARSAACRRWGAAISSSISCR